MKTLLFGKSKNSVLIQRRNTESGLTSLANILMGYGISHPNIIEWLNRFAYQKLYLLFDEGENLLMINQLVSALFFESKGFFVNWINLKNIKLPVITLFNDKFIVITRVLNESVEYISPERGFDKTTKDCFVKKWNNIILTVYPIKETIEQINHLIACSSEMKEVKFIKEEYNGKFAASGACTEIYKGYSSDYGDVCIKHMPKYLVDNARYNAFTNEIHVCRYLKNMDIENIVRIYSVEEKRNIILTEWTSRGTIVQLSGAIKIKICIKFMCQIYNCIQTLLRNNIAHLDIHPRNILLFENDIAKITDFGKSVYLEKIPDDSLFDNKNYKRNLLQNQMDSRKSKQDLYAIDWYGFGIICLKLFLKDSEYIKLSREFEINDPGIFVKHELATVVLKSSKHKLPEKIYELLEIIYENENRRELFLSKQQTINFEMFL